MAATLDIDARQALAFRLKRQHLLEPAADMRVAAATLVGAQAQVQSAAGLQLRARAVGVDEAALRKALYDERTLVRLWGQRGTLHLARVDDLPLILGLRRRMARNYYAKMGKAGLTRAQIDRLAAAIADALAEAGPLSRFELADRLTPRLGDWARPWLVHSWGGAIKLAAALGHVCHGPERARAIAFARLDRWVVPPPVLNEDAALAALARRHLAAFGPANPADFAKFAGIGRGEARAAFAAVAGETVPVSIDGAPAVALAADEADLRAAEAPGHLAVLPLFDPYLLAHADTGLYLDPARRPSVYRKAGWISAVVLREGRVAATWEHRRRAGGVAVALRPFGRLAKGEKGRIRTALETLLDASVDWDAGRAAPEPEPSFAAV